MFLKMSKINKMVTLGVAYVRLVHLTCPRPTFYEDLSTKTGVKTTPIVSTNFQFLLQS